MVEIRNINTTKHHLNVCFMQLVVIYIVLKEMGLKVLYLIKSDINNLDVHRNEYMEDRILSWDL